MTASKDYLRLGSLVDERTDELVAQSSRRIKQYDSYITGNGVADTRPEPPPEARVDGPQPLLRQLAYVMANTLPACDGNDRFDDELVEGVIGRRALVVLYGDSNSGKTFAAIDLCCSVASGVPWLGRNTVSGLVVYLASESPTSVELRLRAYQHHHRTRVPMLAIVRSPINLYDSDADIAALLNLITELEREHGEKVVLLVGDTLARLSAGANENSGEDMGVVVKHIDAIRAATDAAFLLIHHTGKDAARGMRGWSGLRAAVDTEIEMTEDEVSGVRTAEITKQRDLPSKGTRIGLRLEAVTLGLNRWGALRGSCVVLSADVPTKQGKDSMPVRQSEITGAIVEVLTARGTGMRKSALAKHFEGRFKDNKSALRVIRKMVEAGRLIEVADIVALPGPSRVVADGGEPVAAATVRPL